MSETKNQPNLLRKSYQPLLLTEINDDGLTEKEAVKAYGKLFLWRDYDLITCDACGTCIFNFSGCRCEPKHRFWQHWYCIECADDDQCVSFCSRCYKTAKCPKFHQSPLFQWNAVKTMLLSICQAHFPAVIETIKSEKYL